MRKKLTKQSRRKDLTGLNLAALKKEIEDIWEAINAIGDIDCSISHLYEEIERLEKKIDKKKPRAKK